MKANSLLPSLWLVIGLVIGLAPALAAEPNASRADGEQDSATVLQSFVDKDSPDSEIVAIDDQTKRIVMFAMGVPLLILLIATAALGVAMGVYGKPVYLPHMICAGLSLTLAIAHAVVGIVWFYPF